MDFSFQECGQKEIMTFIEEYVGALSSPIESFLEDHIINSNFYTICLQSNVAGYFAVHGNQLLTQFYLRLSFCDESQRIFQRVLEEQSIQSIFVPTCDELLLSLVLDHDYQIRNQAYFFQDSQSVVPNDKLYRDGEFREAIPEDAEQIVEVSGDFLDKLKKRIKDREIFTFTKEKQLIGVGIAERSRVLKGYASIGMFTNEHYRKQGIGRTLTLIHHLKEWCYSHDLIPICGCYYHNDLSKRTLESAGMVTKTRLLNVRVS